MEPMEAPPPGVDRLIDLVTNAALSQVVAVAAELGIPDILGEGSRSINELAELTRSDARAVRRLLQALTACELVRECNDGNYSLTSLGTLIRLDEPCGLRASLLWWGKYRWKAWGHLL